MLFNAEECRESLSEREEERSLGQVRLLGEEAAYDRLGLLSLFFGLHGALLTYFDLLVRPDV